MGAVIALGIWMVVVVGIVHVEELLKPRQFGRIFGITERTVRDWIAARKIEVIKIGASVRIPASEVQRLIHEGRRPALLRRRNSESGLAHTGEGPGSGSRSEDEGPKERASWRTDPKEAAP